MSETPLALEPWMQEAYEAFMEDVNASETMLESTMDEGKANWVCNMIANWEAEIERRAAAHARAERRLKGMIAWFKLKYGAELDLFLSNVLAADNSKKKSLELACGVRLGRRKCAEAIMVTNPAAFMAFLKEEGIEAITTVTTSKEVVDTEAIQGLLSGGVFELTHDNGLTNTLTGDVLPGVSFRPAGDTFHITVPKPKDKAGTPVEAEDA